MFNIPKLELFDQLHKIVKVLFAIIIIDSRLFLLLSIWNTKISHQRREEDNVFLIPKMNFYDHDENSPLTFVWKARRPIWNQQNLVHQKLSNAE